MKFLKLGIFSLLATLVLVLPFSVSGETLLIQPSNDDTELNQFVANGNFGIDTVVRIASWFGHNDRGIFRFDFSALPDNATITSATFLSLYHNAGIDCVGRTLWVYELTQVDWVETEATWNNYRTGSAWTNPGGDFTTINGASALVPEFTGEWIEFDVLGLIQHFQANHNEIANVLVKDGTEDNPTNISCYFRSNDYLTLGQTPKLEITYTLPPPPFSFNIIPMEMDFSGKSLAYVGEVFGDLYPYIGVLVGIPLAFWIIGKSIETAKERKKKGKKFN